MYLQQLKTLYTTVCKLEYLRVIRDTNYVLKAPGAEGGGGESPRQILERESGSRETKSNGCVICWMKAKVVYVGERWPEVQLN